MSLESSLPALAQDLLGGRISPADFLARMANGQAPAPLPACDVGVAQVDLDRGRRCGFPEVVFGQGKTPEAIERIFRAQLAAGIAPLATRVEPDQAAPLSAAFAAGVYNSVARTFRIPAPDQLAAPGAPRVTVVTAGTSDLPVAEEARETALWMGCQVELVCDVGVAGPHRLPQQLPRILGADAVVVVAGMEGALPSVVGGYVSAPIIAVPTSVGYGAAFGGLAALLGMLNSCASNVTVVNIDAGFKGGYVAGVIATRAAAARALPR